MVYPKPNSWPLKIGLPKRKGSSSTHHVAGAMLSSAGLFKIVTFMTWPSQSKLELFLKTFPRLVTWYLVLPTIDTGVPSEPLERWKARKYDFWQEYIRYIKLFSSQVLCCSFSMSSDIHSNQKSIKNPSSLLFCRNSPPPVSAVWRAAPSVSWPKKKMTPLQHQQIFDPKIGGWGRYMSPFLKPGVYNHLLNKAMTILRRWLDPKGRGFTFRLC